MSGDDLDIPRHFLNRLLCLQAVNSNCAPSCTSGYRGDDVGMLHHFQGVLFLGYWFAFGAKRSRHIDHAADGGGVQSSLSWVNVEQVDPHWSI